jgi:predicted metal-dependent peptidase
MKADTETKLSAARTRLILDKPFLGALVLRLPLVAADPKWCKTSGTDARSFYFNEQYIEGLSLAQTQFVLAHEALHCALSHFARRQHRVKHRWDIACDFAINGILIKEGLQPTPDALYLDTFDGMTAEEIYPMLDDLEDQEPMDQHLYDEEDQGEDSPDGGSGQGREQESSGGGSEAEIDENAGGAPQPPPLEGDEKDQLSIQWQQRLAGAAQQAMQAGKMGGALARMLEHLLQPQLPWRMLLARYMSANARTDYNYTRPSRREGNAILPSLRSHQIDIVVTLDTSGSINATEMDEFMSEIDAIKGQVNARITLQACDHALAANGPWEYESWEAFTMPGDITGGGGTSFKPVFEWLDKEGRRPDLLVYFTDAEGQFPEREPPFPVIWLVKGRAAVPWGQRIQLN